jgi:hypothetical protein
MNEQILKAGWAARVAEFLQWPCETTSPRYSYDPAAVDSMPQQS